MFIYNYSESFTGGWVCVQAGWRVTRNQLDVAERASLQANSLEHRCDALERSEWTKGRHLYSVPTLLRLPTKSLPGVHVFVASYIILYHFNVATIQYQCDACVQYLHSIAHTNSVCCSCERLCTVSAARFSRETTGEKVNMSPARAAHTDAKNKHSARSATASTSVLCRPSKTWSWRRFTLPYLYKGAYIQGHPVVNNARFDNMIQKAT